MSNDLISRSVAIDEFYKRVGGDLSISDIKYIETVLNGIPTACHVDMIIDKMDEIIRKYRAIGTPEECRNAMDRQKAKAPNFEINFGDYTSRFICECGKRFVIKHDRGLMSNNDAPNFCPNCGQRLDWS